MPDDTRASLPGGGRFSLAANPFAILGATPRASIADLAELARGLGTPAAASALRVLSVPRTRLGAEVSFLPGAAGAAAGVLAALDRNERPALVWLPPAAQANVLAHLCAAGQGIPADRAALAAAQPAPNDPALIATLNADRAAAGVPPLQPAALRAEQDTLLDQHAAALVASCMAAFAAPLDAAGELAALVRLSPSGTAAALMRRAAAAWARSTASDLAGLEEAAGAARDGLLEDPDGTAVGVLCQAIQDWAALDAPQRAADALAGLDHEPALRALRPWRGAASDLANEGNPGLAHQLADALASTFADLPGEAAALRADARTYAGQQDEMALDDELAPLRALAGRLGTDPEALQADLLKGAFGPGARGAAGELWTLFDAACRASTASDAPWTILRALVQQIGGPWRRPGAKAASVLQAGLIERAAADGRTDLVSRLTAEQRGLTEAVLTEEYEAKAKALRGFWSNGLIQRRAALAALRRLLPAVGDPVRRAALVEQERQLAKRGGAWVIYLMLAIAGGALVRAGMLDSNYARNAPYRQAAPRAPAPTVPAPILAAPAAGDDDSDADGPLLPKLPAPSAKFPDEQPAKAPAFPVRTPREVQPQPTGGALTQAEVTWCVFNGVRLDNAEIAATPRQLPGVLTLRVTWTSLCKGARTMPRQHGTSARSAAASETRLADEGRAMLRGGK